MEILLSDVLGFCFGVRRAITLAEEALHAGHTVNTLGPLVHNAQETQRLDQAGIHTVDTPDALTGDTVVVRAHGARPEIFDTLRARGLHVVDATCPIVQTSQRYARECAEQGMTLVIVGHPHHPEVQGVLGYAASPAFVLTDPQDVATLPDGIVPCVIAQTTIDEPTFLEVVERLRARYPDVSVRNTVCSATRRRQQAARRLAEQVDVLYVIGGRHSSNTNRLLEICLPVCPRTYLIETADEIDPDDVHGLSRVGVTAGASTPAWLIEQVVARLHQLSEPLSEP